MIAECKEAESSDTRRVDVRLYVLETKLRSSNPMMGVQDQQKWYGEIMNHMIGSAQVAQQLHSELQSQLSNKMQMLGRRHVAPEPAQSAQIEEMKGTTDVEMTQEPTGIAQEPFANQAKQAQIPKINVIGGAGASMPAGPAFNTRS